MLVTKEWSPPRPLEYGKGIRLLYSGAGFTLRIYNSAGAQIQKEITQGSEYRVEASEIKHINPQQISFKTETNHEIHLRFEFY